MTKEKQEKTRQKTEKAERRKKRKSKYNVLQNTIYMFKFAAERKKSVIILMFIGFLLSLSSNLINLFLAPTILGVVERGESFSTLLSTITGFAFAIIVIQWLSSYVRINSDLGKVYLRVSMIELINLKHMRTSYPNSEDTAFLEKRNRCKWELFDSNGVPEAIWANFSNILLNVSGFIIYLFIISNVDIVLGVLCVVIPVAVFFINRKIYRWSYEHRDEESQYTSQLYWIHESSKNMILAKDIRIFGMTDWLKNLYKKTLNLYNEFIKKGVKHEMLGNVVELVSEFLRNGIVYVYLIVYTVNNGLSASEFLLYLNAVSGFSEWIYNFMNCFLGLQRQSYKVSIIRELLETPEPFLFEEGRSIEPEKNGKYDIDLRNVTFRYPNSDKNVIENLNLHIKAGENLAIVGLNGAGKTTLVKLICGFYDPTDGEVLLNGEDIRKLNRRDYYKFFSAVFQDFSMLEATVAENISQMSPREIDMKRVQKCAEESGIDKKINQFPKGYDTPVGKKVYDDGILLSGGETQKLFLARALYKEAPIIVLDEPTAALDPLAENEVYEKYSEMTDGKTSVYISHRLASTRFCDRIIYLENGRICEEGTHDELIKKGGKYSDLFDVKSYYYKEEIEF